MKLSIGMMVKNESKYLRKCLESLKPIRDSIESELIIVDTGSTDDTVEIAKEFTDKVYFHEWNSNFSEMRNITIKYCTGEWVLIIDGDEVISNPNGIIQFLNSSEIKKHKTASFAIKNFTSINNDEEFTVFTAVRIFKKDSDFRFEGAIHNQPIWKKPLINLDSEIEHYGYINNDKELMDKKFLRTSRILKSNLEKNPENIYYIYQLAVSYAMHGDLDDALETIQKAYHLVKSKMFDLNKHMYVNIFLAKMYLTNGKFGEVETICLEATKKEGFYIDLYYYLAKAQFSTYKNEEAIEAYNKYLKKLKDFNNFEVADDLSIIDYTLGNHDYACLDMATLYERIGNYEDALTFIKKIKSNKVLNSAFNTSMSLYTKLNKFEELRDFYNHVATNHSLIKDNFMSSLELYSLKSNKKIKENIFKAFSEGDTEYALLNKLRLSSEGEYDEFNKNINNLNFINLPDYFGDILYYFLCKKISLIKYLGNVNDFKIKNYFNYLALCQENLGSNLYDYLKSYDNTELSLDDVRIYKILAVYLFKDKDISDEKYSEILDEYLVIGEQYLSQTYHEDIIQGELTHCMKDEEDLFLMFMHLANKNKNSEAIYIRYLRKALSVCNYMNKGIDILSERVKESLEAKDRINEMGTYKTRVKKNITELIEGNRLQEATILIDEYEDIIKDDFEIYSMRAVVEIMQNRLEDSENTLIKALDRFEGNFDLNYNLAYVYEQMNDYNKALLYYKNAEKSCEDIPMKITIKENITRILADYKVQIIPEKKKIVFFSKGDDKFIEDIIIELSSYYETKKINVTEFKQIDEGMKWADICWFEWCDELIAYGSKHRLAGEKKIICRLHSYEAFTEYPLNVNWEKIYKVIFVAKHIRDVVLKRVNTLKKEQTIVISNGLNLKKYSYKTRKPGFNIAYVGYINYKKGPMLLLHTFKAIYDKDNRYKLYIAGTFQDQRDVLYYSQMIKEMGLENNVLYEGWQDNIDRWLEDKNYILCTSVLESQNVSVMQAMAKGIKPLVHNFVGAKEIYPEEYVWNSIDESITMITNTTYNPKSYREFINNNYSLEKQVSKIKSTLEDLKHGEIDKMNARETVEGTDTFDYATYWNNRLNKNFDIEGVGYIGMGKIYNKYMYQIRFDILNYIVWSFFPKGLRKKQVLELGPGIGLFTDYFYKQKASYKAIDISERSVKELKGRYKNYSFTLGDLSNPELFESNKYDLVFAADVLLHLTNEEKYTLAINNIARSLKETGYAIVFDPITVVNVSSPSPHVVIRDIEYIKKVCTENGLEVVDMLPCSFFMNFPFDKELFSDNEKVSNIFSTIQKYFGSAENCDSDKEIVAKCLTVFEKLCLIDFNFGLSEKVVILKKITNEYEVKAKLSINKVWDIHSVQKEFSIAKKRISDFTRNGDIVELDKLFDGLIDINYVSR